MAEPADDLDGDRAIGEFQRFGFRLCHGAFESQRNNMAFGTFLLP
jgi:hypothetical protein